MARTEDQRRWYAKNHVKWSRYMRDYRKRARAQRFAIINFIHPPRKPRPPQLPKPSGLSHAETEHLGLHSLAQRFHDVCPICEESFKIPPA